jgi:hypothetical protein
MNIDHEQLTIKQADLSLYCFQIIDSITEIISKEKPTIKSNLIQSIIRELYRFIDNFKHVSIEDLIIYEKQVMLIDKIAITILDMDIITTNYSESYYLDILIKCVQIMKTNKIIKDTDINFIIDIFFSMVSLDFTSIDQIKVAIN